MIWQFDPYEGMKQLPPHAPAQSLHPTNYPTWPVWEARLRELGIDPGSAGAIIAAIVQRGYSFWLVGTVGSGRAPSYRVLVLEPEPFAVWAWSGDQPDPVSAFAQVLAICLECPP
jgi:hypothetical protein